MLNGIYVPYCVPSTCIYEIKGWMLFNTLNEIQWLSDNALLHYIAAVSDICSVFTNGQRSILIMATHAALF